MVPIPLKLYSLGDRTEGVKFDDDGSLTVTIGPGEPDSLSFPITASLSTAWFASDLRKLASTEELRCSDLPER